MRKRNDKLTQNGNLRQRREAKEDVNEKPPDHRSPTLTLEEDELKQLTREGIAQATRTRRSDGNHQATVCVICDRVIIGTESIHLSSKDRILLNEKRLSVKTYEEFYGEQLHPLLVKQYSVNDLPGLLLSPRSYRVNDCFETCSSCYTSMKPCKTKGTRTPPKHAIANGFVIGHIPSEIAIKGEDGPRQIDLTDQKISEIMCAALARQRPYGFIFAFIGGAHQSVMGQFSFFEMNQSHI